MDRMDSIHLGVYGFPSYPSKSIVKSYIVSENSNIISKAKTQDIRQSLTGNRSTFEFPSQVNLSGPSENCI